MQKLTTTITFATLATRGCATTVNIADTGTSNVMPSADEDNARTLAGTIGRYSDRIELEVS